MRREHRYYVYILTNPHRTVLYTGVTNDLARRLREHREGRGSGFTRRYNTDRLVYVEAHRYIGDAIAREKQIKAGSRKKKLDLINESNPEWDDLAGQV